MWVVKKDVTPMNYRAIQFIKEAKFLRGNEKIILHCIAYYCRDEHDFNAWPSLKTLAADSGLSLSTVKRTLASLLESKVLNKRQRKSDEHGFESCVYTINKTALEKPQQGVSPPPLVQDDPRGMSTENPPIVQNEPPPRVKVDLPYGHYAPSLGSNEHRDTDHVENNNIIYTNPSLFSPQILNNRPLSRFIMSTEKGRGVIERKTEENEMNEFKAPKTETVRSWTEQRIAFYKLLSAFKEACGDVLGLGHLIPDPEAPTPLKGHLPEKLEKRFVDTVVGYAKEHKISKFNELETHLKALGDYIRSRKPHQLKERNLALGEICRRPGWFDTWMAQALAGKKPPLAKPTPSPVHVASPPPPPSEEEIKQNQRDFEALKAKLGIHMNYA
jgi:hypothetical protein